MTIALDVVLGLLLLPVAVLLIEGAMAGFTWLSGRQQAAAPAPQPVHAPNLSETQAVWRDPWHENWAKDDPVGYSEGYQKDLNAYLGRAHQVLRTRFRNSSAALKADRRHWHTERSGEEYIATEHYQRDVEALRQQSPPSVSGQ
jgi:hypothetical protein